MVRVTWVIAQIVPPALLTYFGRTLYLCVTEIGPAYFPAIGHPSLGKAYSIASLALIPSISILFLRLYFLPSNQSVPPRDPPRDVALKSVIFECLSPSEAAIVRRANDEEHEGRENEPVINRCWRGKCGGRWKPARARHCSECGTCRAGFDHHCGFFANCLTVPYLPTFMCMLTLTPPTILVLSSPLLLPIGRRAVSAWSKSWSDENVRRWWYEWPLSWVIAGGPVGRYIGGIVLGWKALDREDGGGSLRVEMGILIAIGLILALMTAGLGLATRNLIRRGHLTVDRERAKSHARAQAAVDVLRRAGEPIPPEALANVEGWVERHHFWIPEPTFPDGGRIVDYKGDAHPYDLGLEGNWSLTMGDGWGWVLPWVALRRGMGYKEILNWPLSPAARAILERCLRDGEDR